MRPGGSQISEVQNMELREESMEDILVPGTVTTRVCLTNKSAVDHIAVTEVDDGTRNKSEIVKTTTQPNKTRTPRRMRSAGFTKLKN